jgi:hypothetical protein
MKNLDKNRFMNESFEMINNFRPNKTLHEGNLMNIYKAVFPLQLEQFSYQKQSQNYSLINIQNSMSVDMTTGITKMDLIVKSITAL